LPKTCCDERFIILGGGGFGREVFGLLRASGYEVAGFLDPDPSVAESLPGPLLGGDGALLSVAKDCAVTAAVVAVGQTRSRQRLFRDVRDAGLRTPKIQHATYVDAARTEIGEGTILYPGAVIMADVRLGRGVVANSGVTIGHDTRIGDFCNLNPGAHLAGRVDVGPRSTLGIGCCVREGISIGADTVVGAGAVVVKDLPSGCVAYGVPARPVESDDG
jgi:sugar O-acyltransferase (sialic acid O-acetyltransferase NeuD family)